jgi:hypothetical protein
MNTASNGWFWLTMLISINIVMLTWMSQYGWRGISATMFVMTLLVLPLRFLGLVQDYVLVAYVLLAAASMIIMWVKTE